MTNLNHTTDRELDTLFADKIQELEIYTSKYEHEDIELYFK